jgi:signal recognition particle GTPase
MRKRNFTKQVGLILTEEIYTQLIEQTNKEETTISEWIRGAIAKKLEDISSKENNQRHL